MDIKKKNRFNLIDAFVVLIILALIAGTVYFAFKENNEFQSELRTKNITYTVLLENVDKDFLNVFETDGHVLNSSTLEYIGKISKIKTEKAGVWTDKAEKDAAGDGYTVIKKEYGDVYDVYITITAKASMDERGIAYIDRQRITVGTCVPLRFGNFSVQAHITAFSTN
ncbi:MAG: DUF4330 domain-containing protein [Clostridia bacterium]|nr:DUF4330 domain-containing protein [Clostridia bacterium]